MPPACDLGRRGVNRSGLARGALVSFMGELLEWLLHDLLGQLVVSVLVVVAILLLRAGLIREIRGKSEFLSDQQRRWISFTRNAAFTLLLLILAYLWADEIKNFALSVAAVTVALVLATKELLLCISGSVLRTSSGAFAIGDWIEVDGVRGEVTHHNAFATSVQEIEGGHRYDYTGRTITIPNSIFLSKSITNLNFMRRYVFHRFSITVEADCDIFAVVDPLRQKAEEHCEGFMEVARRYNRIIETRAGLDIPSPEPRIEVDNTREGRNVLTITLFCPTAEALSIEQCLRRDAYRLLQTAPGANAAAKAGS